MILFKEAIFADFGLFNQAVTLQRNNKHRKMIQ